MEFHLATIWERIADEYPAAPALVHGEVARSWAEFDDRGARLAGVLRASGLAHGSKVALYLRNCSEYLETCFAALKIGAVPVNINYRYLEDELAYLLDNADAEALIFGSELGQHVAAVRDKVPKLKLLIDVGGGDDQRVPGALDFEAALGGDPVARAPHSPDDLILLYTGGTTGMPKGVMHRCGALSNGFLASFAREGVEPPETVDDLVAIIDDLRARDAGHRQVVACPLMHGVGLWSAMTCHVKGGCVITLPGQRFDPEAVLSAIGRERATHLSIVGDVFARPLWRALQEAAADGRPYDVGSLREIISAGAMWSASVKQGLLEHADVTLVDSMGASEGGTAVQITRRGDAVDTARFKLNPTAKVFTDDGREVVPGSGETGMLATSFNVPLGYYKDPEKTARTFRTIDGVRYSFPGDYARVEADGSVTLLGRGSMCINSGGEKIYPEEVEESIKAHGAVNDCLVVGVPDERFGETVAAVVALEGDQSVTDDELVSFLRGRLAGYKQPRTIVFVDAVRRGPNGKADYAWARQVASGSV
jgi:fatty-acyl-CoA synthase